MSVENIEDHGAVPNPDDPSLSAARKNLHAIINAADAAGAGGTVYIPANIYYIGDDIGRFTAFGGREPSGISITGDGPEQSVIGVSEHVSDSQNCTIFEWSEGVNHGTVSVDNVKLEGNYENLGNLVSNGNGGIGAKCEGAGTFNFSNVWVRGQYTMGIRIENGDGRLERCTIEETAIALENDSGGDRVSHHLALQPPSGDTITVDSCLFRRGSGEVVDIHAGAGNVVLKNCWGRSLGTGVFKISAGNRIELRNSYMESYSQWLEDNLTASGDFHGRAMARRISNNQSETPTLVLDNVEFHNCNRHAVEARNYPLQLQGDMVAIHNAARDPGRDSVLRDDADGALTHVSIDRLSVHDSDAAVFSAPNADGSIGTVRRANNAGLGDTGGLSIGTDEPGKEPFAPSVPTKDDVGINTASAGSSGPSVAWQSPSDGTVLDGSVTLQIAASDHEDSPDAVTVEYNVDGNSWVSTDYNSDTTYFEASLDASTLSNGSHTLTARATDSDGDKSTATVDVVAGALFADWTPQWISTTDDWTVSSGDSFVGGHALAFENTAGTRDRFAISCDAAGTHADVEVVDRFRVPTINPETNRGFHARLFLRGSGSEGNENGYWIEIEDRNDAFRVGKYVNGNSTTLQRFGTPAEDTFFYRRFRATGTTIQAKVWPASESEPSGWDVELSDSSLKSGWVGLGSFDPGLVETDTISVATGGATAEMVEPDAAPTISWATPSDGGTVTETVGLQVAAGDEADSTGSLAVEYRVDGGDWTATSYNADTGYYETSLDTTTLADGSHTLTARATDSANNAATASVDVTVDNPLAISTVDARNVTESTATLVGDVTSLSGASDATVGFEWRPVGSNTWTADGRQTVSATGEFTTDISGLEADTDHEFRAVATDPDSVTGNPVGFQTSTTSNEAPTIEQFDVIDQSSTGWHQYQIEWAVADSDGNLDKVISTLRRNGSVVATESTGVSGSDANYTHVLRVRGNVDEMTLTVNDTQNLVGHASQQL
ncbi:Ig-like domain-containing protein [Haloarcula sp. H-GB5]